MMEVCVMSAVKDISFLPLNLSRTRLSPEMIYKRLNVDQFTGQKSSPLSFDLLPLIIYLYIITLSKPGTDIMEQKYET